MKILQRITHTFIFRKGTVQLLKDSNGEAGTALIPYSRSDTKNLLDKIRSDAIQVGPNIKDRVSPKVVDQLVHSVPEMANHLRRRHLYQMVASPEIKQGLKSGTLQLMRSKQGGVYSMAQSSTTGKIGGLATFKKVGRKIQPTPAMALQVLNAVAGTMELQSINEKLGAIRDTLNRILQRQRAERLGRVYWAVDVLEDLIGQHRITGTVNEDMLIRLSHVEELIGSAMYETDLNVDDLRAHMKALKQQSGKKGAKSAEKFLQEDGAQAVEDMNLLIALTQFDLRIEQMRLLVNVEHSPENIERQLARTADKMNRHAQSLAHLPSLRGIQKHAKKCVNQMNGFQKKITGRKVVKDVDKLPKLKDVAPASMPAATTQGSDQPGLLIWEDEDGQRQVRVISPQA